jgi:glycosyltransferase involved in cell wall biosynthesis
MIRDRTLDEDQETGQRRSLRILRVADVQGAATAGMSGYMLHSAAEMERRGHRVSFWFEDSLAPGLRHAGIRRLLVPWVIAAKVVLHAIRGWRHDIVEINAASAGPYGLLSRLFRVWLPPCLVLSHGLDERCWQAELTNLRAYGRKAPLRSRILVPLTLLSQARLAVRTAEGVLLVSSADRDYLNSHVRIPAERLSCSFGGVSEQLFEIERPELPDMRVLFVGGWLERKGSRELVAAWRRVGVDRPQIRLTLAGVHDAERVLADTAGLRGVDIVPKVSREELADLLARHDVFVLPSWFEGMPLAMLEAAAAGLACVVTGVCGNLDVFRAQDPRQDGGILIPPSDADALYQALITLADDHRLRSALGARARERARHFTWSKNAERTLAAYSAAAGRRPITTRSRDGHSCQTEF